MKGLENKVLEINDLRVSYGEQEVLGGVNLQISCGEWFCLLGPNGVGKTTLLRCIASRLLAASGEILIAGHSLSRSPTDAKRCLGYACAPDQLPGLLTGRQCLEVYAIAKELDSVDADVLVLADALNFSQFIDGFVDTYSLGTRQKLCVLLALLGNPELIVLDEAFNGLDPHSALVLKRDLNERLADGRSGVLLATHSLDIVEHYADAVGLLLDGGVANVWTAEEINRLKSSGKGALEQEIAAWSLSPT